MDAGCIAFDLAAIMRRAYSEGRFAFAVCRTLAARRLQLSHWLRKAWQAAKAEAAELMRRVERDTAVRRDLAARAAASVALAASYGTAAAIRQEIEAEHYRQHFNASRIADLRAALATMGA
jgi:predicted amino acid dehydrogenase